MIGVGIIPASRFLRRRAAAEDLGADVDAFWSAAPRLYDFSQSQQPPRPPSPPPPPPAAPHSPSPPPPAAPGQEEEEEEARDECLLFLRRSPSPPPAAQGTPSPAPELEPRAPCLLTLLRGGLAWGGKRSVTYHRHRPGAGGGGSPLPWAVVAGEDGKARAGAKKMKRLEEVEKEAAAAEKKRRRKKRVVVKTEEENRRVTRGSLRHRRGASRAAKKKVKTEVEDEEPEAASCEDDKRKVVKTEKTGSRKRERRGRDADKGAKKVLPVKEDESSGNKKRKRSEPAPDPSSRVKREVVGTEQVRVYHRRRRHATAKLTIPKDEDEEENKPAAPNKPTSPSGKVDRWSARRYAAGESVLLDVLRTRGATAGAPVPRAELRAEARRRIGDTGLLDHLLLHASDKVPSRSAERIRRRYNVDGALEYFLEPAGLKALRKEAGVEDPFWVPPPGWKLGDPTSPEALACAVKKQVEELAAELAVVKRQMKKLSSNLVHLGKQAYISWKGYDCMLKTNENLGKELLSLEEKYNNATQANGELKEELLLLKDNYESLAEKNAKLEDQMVDISSCFQFLKDDLTLPETDGGEQHMLMLTPADHSVKKPSTADIEKQEASTGNVPGDVVVGASKATAGEGSIIEKRKCSMRICKPQRTFAWPDTLAGMATGEACSPKALPEPLTPGGDLIVTNFDSVIYNLAPSSMEEYLATDGLPTPTSASSTTTASTKLPLLPTPASPIQQLSTATSRDDEPCSGGLNSQLSHKALSSSSSAPCLLTAGKKALMLGGGNVGTELALATPSY